MQDWEDKCLDLEHREQDAVTKCEKAAAAERKSAAEVMTLTKELRAVKAALGDRTEELKII